ncbi:hypothetical protein C8J55DRAFT_518253 [Lentinula edodes]|uniref:Uncharacterized protein n=1 Tax=Lentinula lateritia TaxID=40482 RepID=A0A9W9DKD7_9AGAR|nr:hypothetical protein C8J55DRAFT_518253 [Lentinula edodes]
MSYKWCHDVVSKYTFHSDEVPQRYPREGSRARMSNERTLQHFSASSSHSLTRAGVGWIFEQNMHSRMCRSGGALPISNASHHMLMHPPTHLFPGTMAGLKSPGVCLRLFLLDLPVKNFPGIDGVLGDTTGNFRLFHFINNCFVPSSNRISDPFLLLSYTNIDFARNASFVSFFRQTVRERCIREDSKCM